MAPLLKPTECSLLVLDSAGEPGPKDRDVMAGRNADSASRRLVWHPILSVAASVSRPAEQMASKPAHQQIYSPPMPGNPWGETPLGLALARASRMSLLICGYWLDECITFTALNALGEGYESTS